MTKPPCCHGQLAKCMGGYERAGSSSCHTPGPEETPGGSCCDAEGENGPCDDGDAAMAASVCCVAADIYPLMGGHPQLACCMTSVLRLLTSPRSRSAQASRACRRRLASRS